MEGEDATIIKLREIEFMDLHPDREQARTAARLLTGISGIMEVSAPSAVLLQVRYDLLQVSLEQIETALGEFGFHLSNKLVHKLRRALYYYTEETERANNGCPRGDSNCTRKIFINRYQQLEHGCQDPRPDHWRRYL